MIGKKFDIKDENLTEKMHIEILDEIRKVIDNSTTNRQQTICMHFFIFRAKVSFGSKI